MRTTPLSRRFIMNFLLVLLSLILIPLGNATMVLAEVKEPPPYEGSDALKSMKALAGTWEGTHTMHGKEIPATIEYKVSSNGSTVVETMFPGTAHEMVNVYHDKSGKLAMTHYCSVGNQPHLDLTWPQWREIHCHFRYLRKIPRTWRMKVTCMT